MSSTSPHFFNMVLRNGHFSPCKGMYPTFDEALEGVKKHFERDPNLGDKTVFRDHPNLRFTVYSSQDDDLDAAIVEVNLGYRQLMNFSLYKICKGVEK